MKYMVVTVWTSGHGKEVDARIETRLNELREEHGFIEVLSVASTSIGSPGYQWLVTTIALKVGDDF